MINFYFCENRFYEQNNSQKLLDDTIINLNRVFSEINCPKHHNESWSIGVDLLSNGNLQFHSESQNSCDFASILIDKEVIPFLKTENKYPLSPKSI